MSKIRTRLILAIIVISASAIVVLSVYEMTVFNKMQTQSLEYNDRFRGDDHGEFEKWCNENDGVWDALNCGFYTQDDWSKANDDLESRQNLILDKKYAQFLCDLMETECPDNPQFDASFNMHTTEISANSHNMEFEYVVEYFPNYPDNLRYAICTLDGDCEWNKTSMERHFLEKMNCSEITKHNSLVSEYETKDNRKFAREKVLECSNDDEYLAYYGLCDQLYDRKISGESYLLEDHQMRADQRLQECGDEFWLEEFETK